MRIEIDEEYTLVGQRQGRAQIECRRRFADATFLVGDGDHLFQEALLFMVCGLKF